uniref:Uncharacterized protein n=1 Tax=Glossina brevipalpis TaxID=37001 RepID=A0A1A9WZU1_9MUSC
MNGSVMNFIEYNLLIALHRASTSFVACISVDIIMALFAVRTQSISHLLEADLANVFNKIFLLDTPPVYLKARYKNTNEIKTYFRLIMMVLLLIVVVGVNVGFYSTTCVLCAAGIGFRFDFVPVLTKF